MKRSTLIIIIIFLMVLIVNCNQLTKRDNLNVNEQSDQTIKPATSTVELQPVFTNTVPTKATEVVDEFPETFECLSPVLNLNQDIFGTIVLSQFFENETLLLSLKSGLSKNLGDIRWGMAISPDHKKLAFFTENPSVLHIVDAYGNESLSRLIPDNWVEIIKWVDDDNLLISNEIDLDNYSTVVYNLSDGEVVEYKFDYPFFQSYPNNDWSTYWSTQQIYSPDFSKVIYPQHGINGYMGYTLYDIDTQRTLFEQKVITEYVLPTWNRNGSYFISGVYPKFYNSDGKLLIDNEIDALPYVGGYDLFKISNNGEILDRLTKFSTLYLAREANIALSTNESKMAFWLNLRESKIDKNNQHELIILDIGSKEIQHTCLFVNGYKPFQMFWSPDDEYLVVNNMASNIDNGIVLVDIENWEVVKIDWKNHCAQGWLKELE